MTRNCASACIRIQVQRNTLSINNLCFVVIVADMGAGTTTTEEVEDDDNEVPSKLGNVDSIFKAGGSCNVTLYM
jgi:hypothetical protein